MLKISTWNVNSLNVRLAHVVEFIQQQNIDILCLQELKIIDAKFPLAQLADIGCKAVFLGQPTYNGVAIIYKNHLNLSENSIQYNIINFDDEQKRMIKADFIINNKTITIINGYFPNGQDLTSDKFIYKLSWLKALSAYITSIKNDNLILLGDFNVTFDSKDVYNINLEGGIFCTEQERALFTHLANLDMTDAYRHVNPDKYEFTWWDYRMACFRRNLGLRIDHIWLGKNLIPYLKTCVINKEMRKLEKPSDHAPVTIEMDL